MDDESCIVYIAFVSLINIPRFYLIGGTVKGGQIDGSCS